MEPILLLGSLSKRLFSTIFIAVLSLTTTIIAQTQAPSIQTGVTFQWADTQSNPSDPATLSSVTVNGSVYNSFAAPTSYSLDRLGPHGNHRNKIIQNGTIVNNSSANTDWETDAIAAFQDRNLNHYFMSNNNGRNICGDFSAIPTTTAQLQSLHYSPGIPSNSEGLLAISERNANNCYYIAVYGNPVGGGPEQFLGDTFVLTDGVSQSGPQTNPPPAGSDYWNSGRVVDNNGTIGIALFLLEDLAPVGSTITRVELVGATNDHGDGKVMLFQKYAVPRTEMGCINTEFNGTLADEVSIPAGSTFTLVSGPTPAGQAFTFNSDGSYSYTPTTGFLGDVTFEYQICLPAPNTAVCDTSTVTITFLTYVNGLCSCNSGASDGPLLQSN